MKEVKNPINGEWYKTISDSHVKYSHTIGNNIFYTERINNHNKHYACCFGCLATPLYEADMDEVRAYLPDGHPDKEFVLPYSWYIVVTPENQEALSNWFSNNTVKVGRIIASIMGLRYDVSQRYFDKARVKGFLIDCKTELTTEQFHKYVLKKEEMKKTEDFTIEGTEALLDAFIKDSGISVDSHSGKHRESFKYLTSYPYQKSYYSFSLKPYPTHFVLPQQWDEAMSYVKRYFEQYKEHVIELNDGLKAVIKADKVVIGNKEFNRETLRKWIDSLEYEVWCKKTIDCDEDNTRILVDIKVGKLVDVDYLKKLGAYLNDNIDGER